MALCKAAAIRPMMLYVLTLIAVIALCLMISGGLQPKEYDCSKLLHARQPAPSTAVSPIQRSVVVSQDGNGVVQRLAHHRAVTFPFTSKPVLVMEGAHGWVYRDAELEKWELHTFKAFSSCIPPGKEVIDFGSWIGPTVLYAVALGAKAVYSFEPDPRAHAELVLNAMLNGFGNMYVHHACIAPTTRNLTLYDREGNSISSTYKIEGGKNPAVAKYSRELTVPCYALSEVINHYQLQPGMFIKMDIEGFEVELVPAIKQIFEQYKPTLHLSIHAELRAFKADDFEGLVDALSVFPMAFAPLTPGKTWQAIPASERKQAIIKDGQSNLELLFTWPGACKSLES
jgi:FkbM family methyltransferase